MSSGGKPTPPAEFSTLVLSLGSAAMVHLGEIESPEDSAVSKNLVLAQHSIDLLSMLKEKTAGNLNPDETHYLDSILYDLRVRYVEACKDC